MYVTQRCNRLSRKPSSVQLSRTRRDPARSTLSRNFICFEDHCWIAFFIDAKLENIRPCIVAHNIEIEFRARDLV
jgi:hypothetical protein